MRVLAGHSGWNGSRKRCRYPYLGIQQENHHQASGFVKMKEYGMISCRYQQKVVYLQLNMI